MNVQAVLGIHFHGQLFIRWETQKGKGSIAAYIAKKKEAQSTGFNTFLEVAQLGNT